MPTTRTGRPFTDGATGIRFPILDARAAVEAALVPRLEDVRCTAEEGSIAAAWTSGAGIDNIAARVLRDGEAIIEQDLGGSVTGFRFAASAAGNDSRPARVSTSMLAGGAGAALGSASPASGPGAWPAGAGAFGAFGAGPGGWPCPGLRAS